MKYGKELVFLEYERNIEANVLEEINFIWLPIYLVIRLSIYPVSLYPVPWFSSMPFAGSFFKYF